MMYSTISDYTNKKGKTHKAHFNNGKYIGPCSKLGDHPILLNEGYVYNIIIKEDNEYIIVNDNIENVYNNDTWVNIGKELLANN